MAKPPWITALFLDVGGVLLSNGWDHLTRQRAARTFDLDAVDLEERHLRIVDVYEMGQLTLTEYLRSVVFHTPRGFTQARFWKFMAAQSRPFPGMIDLIRRSKVRHGLKIVVVSNEGRELNDYRIRTFALNGLVDCFITSCYVGVRKPDPEIYRIAMDIAQVPCGQALCIDDRPQFIAVAAALGIHGINHTTLANTRARLHAFGLDPGDTLRVPR